MYGQIHKSPERKKGKHFRILFFEKKITVSKVRRDKKNISNDDHLDVILVKIPRTSPRYRAYEQQGLSISLYELFLP